MVLHKNKVVTVQLRKKPFVRINVKLSSFAKFNFENISIQFDNLYILYREKYLFYRIVLTKYTTVRSNCLSVSHSLLNSAGRTPLFLVCATVMCAAF